MPHGSYSLPSGGEALDVRTSFDFIFLDQVKDTDCLLPAGGRTEQTIKGLRKLAAAMIAEEVPDSMADPAENNSSIPTVYTYWGQFIDHDVTLTGTDDDDMELIITNDNFSPLSVSIIEDTFFNRRRPKFDLDSVYGDGPVSDSQAIKNGMYEDDRIKLRVGRNSNGPGSLPDPDLEKNQASPKRDLPRGTVPEQGPRQAAIGDHRNDENTIVAQFHLAFLKFHNAVVDWLSENDSVAESQLFERARQLTQWHYQWLVINDYLMNIAKQSVVKDILDNEPKFYKPNDRDPDAPYMPLEYSVAAYRFGHTMVRANYDFNLNFGRNEDGTEKEVTTLTSKNRATFEELFAFTAGGGFKPPDFDDTFEGSDSLPFNWIIQWDRFTDHKSPFPERFARKIDTEIAFPLSDMLNEGNGLSKDTMKKIMKNLAQRNLLRGYLFRMPTGQCLADAMGVKRLSEPELTQGKVATKTELKKHGFIERTPLWYYILKESEVREKGESLGEVGSRIVAETIIGLIKVDSGSFMNQGKTRWQPEDGVKLPDGRPIKSIMDFFRFAGVAPMS